MKAKNRQKNPNLFFPLTKNNVSHFGDLNKCKIFFYLEFPFVDYLEYEYTSPPITKMLVFLVVVHLIIIAFNLKNLCPSMCAIFFCMTSFCTIQHVAPNRGDYNDNAPTLLRYKTQLFSPGYQSLTINLLFLFLFRKLIFCKLTKILSLACRSGFFLSVSFL